MLGLAGLGADEILELLEGADRLWEAAGSASVPASRVAGLSVANLILEPSTRTRCSFEIAESRLGIERVTVRGESSSLVKGETLVDTVRTLAAMGVNVFVIRHPEVGVPARVAESLPEVHVVNAGDGTGEHPTQGLLDLLVLRRRWGEVAGRTVLIVGDIVHSRVARSGFHGLRALGAEVVLCGPTRFLPPPEAFPGARRTEDLDGALADCDAVMALRIQRERQSGREESPDPESYRRRYGLTAERVGRLRAEVPVLHPGPLNRGVEIDSEVADGPRSLIWMQVRAGVAVRMAVLTALAASPRGADSRD
ncbi:MAG: aspartate carbamoyltransferase catalytic subunit [Gemmatimonadota bacterium]